MNDFCGHLTLRGAVRDDGRSVLSDQSFRAPFHLSKPYWDRAAGVLLVQVVNPTAGILAGDRLESHVAIDAGAALLITTPSVSRIFRMTTGTAECRQHFTVADGAWLEVMPEALVPHRGSRYQQTTRINVEPGAGLFFADVLMPGRIAHGEAWKWDRLCLDLQVRFAGELVLRDRFDHTGPSLQALAAMAGSAADTCFANVILMAETSDSTWQRSVGGLHGNGLWVGVSPLRRGGWSIRMIGADSLRLRSGLREVRQILATQFPRLKCDPRKL